MPDPADIPAFTIALGGEELLVEYLDGKREVVKVALLKAVAYPAFFRVLADEERLAELVCQKPEGWAATLRPDSLMDIAEKGTALNFSPARRWQLRREQLDQQIAAAVAGQS
jgi:hypothetical protein